MRARKWAALVLVLGLVAAACGDDDGGDADEWPDKLVFGFVPSQEVESLQDDVDAFAAVLSEALGIEVEGVVTTDYTGLGVALGTGQADLGAFGPAGYVLASRAYDNLELLAQSVRFGDPTYHGQFFTNDPTVCDGDPIEGSFYYDDDGNVVQVGPTGSPAQQVGWNADDTKPEFNENDEELSPGLTCPEPVDLSVIVGHTMYYGTETSTSGYIFPTLQLSGLGITEDQYTIEFSGGHDHSVRAVYDADPNTRVFGVSFDDARRAVRHEKADVGEKVIVFNITSPIANDVIAVRSDLPDDLKDAIFQAMSDYIATDEGQAVMEELYSWTDLTRATALTEASLELIAQAIDELGFGG